MPSIASRRLFLRRALSLSILGSSSAGAAYGAGSRGSQLTIERVEVKLAQLPAGLDGFRIAHMSDLHLEPFTTQDEMACAVSACNDLRPDMIALTGDFVTESAARIGELVEVLAGLGAPHGVFASLGNHDFWSGASEVERALTERKVGVLRNEMVNIHARGGRLCVAGFDSAYIARPAVGTALRDWRESLPLVMLMHEPDAADFIAAAGVGGLQLSGHTHGGQLRFGGREPMGLRRAKWGKKYLEGSYSIGGVQLYVNRGIGCVGIPLRIGCPPELTLFTLKCARA